MSLLLDALKKAADDKQKASQAGASVSATDSTQRANDETVEPVDSSADQSLTEELSLQSIDDSQNTPEFLSVNDAEYSEALTLDIEKTDIDVSSIGATKAAGINENKLLPVEGVSVENKASSELNPEHEEQSRSSNRSRYTVSDDALSLLIHKTNRDVKKGKRILLFSVLFVSLAILVSGGFYYYLDMQAEIAALERKHKIAMQSMQSKTNRKQTPENSKIIRNLVSESDLNEKVQYAKEHVASKKPADQTKQIAQIKARKNAADSARNIKATASGLSIQKTNKLDPVGEKLETAWLAYENGQYAEAKKSYRDVLNIEENNRDALLGLGAIAVIEKDELMARDIYLSLLKQNPRDPIATAALSSLHSDKSSLKSDEEYILTTLQKNPDAPHLNFALGNVYAQQNKWKSAQQYYFNAWQHDNENSDYIFNLAVSLDQLGKQQQAIDLYKDSLQKSINKQVAFSREHVKKRINELSGL